MPLLGAFNKDSLCGSLMGYIFYISTYHISSQLYLDGFYTILSILFIKRGLNKFILYLY